MGGGLAWVSGLEISRPAGANNTARYIGSAAGVALTIAVATSTPGHLAQGGDKSLVACACLALAGAATVLALRERHRP